MTGLRSIVPVSVFVAGALVSSCAPRAPVPTHPVYSYAVAPPPAGSWRLEVEATFEGAPSDRLVAPEAGDAVSDVTLVGDHGVPSPLARSEDAWVAAPCRSRCTVRYAIDLATVADACRSMDCDRRVGDAILGRASTFLLRPEPMGDATYHVHVTRHGERFATGLRPDGAGGYVFEAREFGEASFTAFGAIRRGQVDVPGTRAPHGRTRIDVALLGPPLAMGDASVVDFLGKSAACVASLYGRFPVDATVFVVPVRGESHVVFGRVMSLAGASVAVLFGDATPASSVHDEWVVVHELFHLSTPSFVGEGHWLEEGLATYYEPILRERAGWMSEADLWGHFVREMPRGLRDPGDPPDLEDRDDTDATYWGGALFALLADVRILAASGSRRSLDDVVRAALDREGDGTHLSRVADFLRDGDVATSTHELSAVHDAWAVRGVNPNLDALWKKLGIEGVESARGKGSPVILRDDAPMAAVRKAIASGRF